MNIFKIDLYNFKKEGVVYSVYAVEEVVKFSKWSADMIAMQDRLLLAASTRQRNRDIEELKNREKRMTENGLSFPINSYVLVQYPDDRTPSKMLPNLKGPMRVFNQTGNTVEVQSLSTHDIDKISLVAVNRLRPYNYNPDFGDIESVANKDHGEVLVERILNHAGDLKKLKSLDFLVKWTDRSDKYNNWVPWKELRNNSKLFEYLASKGLKKMIPKQFRAQYVDAELVSSIHPQLSMITQINCIYRPPVPQNEVYTRKFSLTKL